MKIELDVDELGAGLLTAAVSDLFHKMRASEEDPLITWVPQERYQAMKNLWDQVEAQTQVTRWAKVEPSGEDHATA